MTEQVVVFPHDAVHIRIEASEAVTREISDHFSFETPGARFMPTVRSHRWDGRIRLFKKGLLPAGLRHGLEEFCHERDYEVVLDVGFEPTTNGLQNRCSTTELIQLIPARFNPRPYQVSAFEHAIKTRRGVFLSVTGSGKTLIIYMIAQRLREEGRVLIIVPTTTLVHQGIEDFLKYGAHPKQLRGLVAGEDRNIFGRFTFATWQSIIREPPEWMDNFRTVIVDEAHGAKSDSLQKILSSAKNAYNRFGFTGTLSGSKTHEMILTGLLGPVHRVATARELMKTGVIAQARLKMLVVKHPDAARKTCPKAYQDEIKYLIDCKARNNFLANLAADLKGNTLVLYTRVEQHGQILFEHIKRRVENRGVHFLHGEIDGEDRNEVRAIVEKAENDIIVASFGVFSQGIDIARLHNIILASPYKSEIIIPQSIGRGLRKGSDKEECNIFDIVDDLSWKRRRNYALKHAQLRLKIYAEQGYDIASYHVNLPNDESLNTETGGSHEFSTLP